MSTETNVNSLIINKMSESKYSQITPVEGQMYATPDDNIVHTSGNETISGTKTFTTNINSSYGTAYGSNSQIMGIQGFTSDGKLASLFQGWAEPTANVTGIYCFNPTGQYAGITIKIDANGNVETSTAIPATSDNSDKIATTNWVRTLGFTPNYSTQVGISLPYTAPANGFISGVLTAAHSENYYIVVNNIQVQRIYGETNQRVTAPFFIPVYKGDVISTTGGTNTVYFYYAR